MQYADSSCSLSVTGGARVSRLWWAVLASALLPACGDSNTVAPAAEPSPPIATALACDDTMKTAFKPDDNTTVTLVKAFKKGDPLALSGTPASPAPPIATEDVCLVKINVGPGNPGPAGALSTSAGIGIEAWLPSPAKWNKRLHVLALGGFGGNAGISSTTVISNASISGLRAPNIALSEGAVSAITDGGHADSAGTGAFAMNPDGTINTTLWTDVSTRAPHEMALKVKALAAAYYLAPHKYAYMEGCSGGGRQGYSEAQNFPGDFDGIVAAAPSINQTQFFPADLYAQIVIQRDLGGIALTPGQLALASGAAVSACDTKLNGLHDGYISDPAQCAYDPTTDPAVLCPGDGGSNASASCLTAAQARAFNKIWFGPTPDGSFPTPGADNGFNVVRSPSQLYWGTPRGTKLTGLLAFQLSKDQVALNLQNSVYARPEFLNATGKGQDGWKDLAYAGFANALYQGSALNPKFGNIDTDNADLRPFQDKGGKMLTYHGLADQLVAPQSSMNYYTRTSNILGGNSATQKFHRLFFVPGMAHCTGIGSADGLVGAAANPPLLGPTQMYEALTNWVESGVAPSTITVTTADTTISRPLCMFPTKLTYVGGDAKAAASYRCT